MIEQTINTEPEYTDEHPTDAVYIRDGRGKLIQIGGEQDEDNHA